MTQLFQRRFRPARRVLALGAAALFVLAAVACGGDDDGSDEDATAQFCEYSAGLGAAPSESQLDELRRLAPSEIGDDVGTYADGLTRIVTESDTELTEDEERAAANVDGWERANCVVDDVDGEPLTPPDSEPVEIDDIDLGEIEPDGGDLGEITDIEVLDEPVEKFDTRPDDENTDSTP